MVAPQVNDKLERLVDEMCELQSKLILLIGGPQSSKSAQPDTYGSKWDLPPLRVGAELGSKLATLPQRQCKLQTTSRIRGPVARHAKGIWNTP